MNEQLHDLAAAYALDALDPDERARFETHLDSCAPCTAAVAEHRAAAAFLAEGEETAPPPGVRGRVMDAIAAEPRRVSTATSSGAISSPASRPAVGRRTLPLAIAAAMVLVAVTAGLAAFVRDVIDDRDAAEDLVAVLASPDARTVVLEGSEGRADLRVVWSPETTGVVVLGDELPAPPDEQVYELWVLADEGPRSAGQFTPADDGAIRRRLALPAEPADGWGVTLEPAGGSPEPTGDILYLGT